MAETFQCTLVTPEAELLSEQVIYANVPAWDGQFGFAPQRAAALIKLGVGALRLETAPGQNRWFYIGGGFAQMTDNRLTLLTQEAVAAEAINVQDAQASLKEAEARRAVSDQEVAAKQRDVARAKAMLDAASHRK